MRKYHFLGGFQHGIPSTSNMIGWGLGNSIHDAVLVEDDEGEHDGPSSSTPTVQFDVEVEPESNAQGVTRIDIVDDGGSSPQRKPTDTSPNRSSRSRSSAATTRLAAAASVESRSAAADAIVSPLSLLASRNSGENGNVIQSSIFPAPSEVATAHATSSSGIKRRKTTGSGEEWQNCSTPRSAPSSSTSSTVSSVSSKSSHCSVAHMCGCRGSYSQHTPEISRECALCALALPGEHDDDLFESLGVLSPLVLPPVSHENGKMLSVATSNSNASNGVLFESPPASLTAPSSPGATSLDPGPAAAAAGASLCHICGGQRQYRVPPPTSNGVSLAHGRIVFVHHRCLRLSSLRRNEGSDSQLVSRVLRASARAGNRQDVRCRLPGCNNPGASVQCAWPDCRSHYHVPCAMASGGEWNTEPAPPPPPHHQSGPDRGQAMPRQRNGFPAVSFSQPAPVIERHCLAMAPVESSFPFYCPAHLTHIADQMAVQVCWPLQLGVQFLLHSTWDSRVTDQDRNLLQASVHCWGQYDPAWFHVRLSSPLQVRQIQPDHWAWCSQMASVDRPQYEVVASRDIEAAEMVGIYLGEIMYASDSQGSSYTAEFWYPENVPAELRARPLVVDSKDKGNETRFINSVSSDSPSFIRQNVRMNTVAVHGQLCIVLDAIHPIEKGQPVVLDYGSNFFDEHDEEEMEVQVEGEAQGTDATAPIANGLRTRSRRSKSVKKARRRSREEKLSIGKGPMHEVIAAAAAATDEAFFLEPPPKSPMKLKTLVPLASLPDDISAMAELRPRDAEVLKWLPDEESHSQAWSDLKVNEIYHID